MAWSCDTMGFLRIDQLSWRRFFRHQLRVATEIDVGVGKVRLVAVAVGNRLVELGLIGSRIDLRQQIALFHRLALVENDLDELAGDLAADDDIVKGDDRADAAQVNRHIVADDRSCYHADGHRSRGRLRLRWIAGYARHRERCAGEDRECREADQQFFRAPPFAHGSRRVGARRRQVWQVRRAAEGLRRIGNGVGKDFGRIGDCAAGALSDLICGAGVGAAGHRTRITDGRRTGAAGQRGRRL
jgi:hypothetical protein